MRVETESNEPEHARMMRQTAVPRFNPSCASASQEKRELDKMIKFREDPMNKLLFVTDSLEIARV